MRFNEKIFDFGQIIVVRSNEDTVSFWLIFSSLEIDDVHILDYYDFVLKERKKCTLPTSVFYERLEGSLYYSYPSLVKVNSIGSRLVDLNSRYNALCKEGLKELKRAEYNYNKIKKEYAYYRDEYKHLKGSALERASQKTDAIYEKYDILFKALEVELIGLIPILIDVLNTKDFKFRSYKPDTSYPFELFPTDLTLLSSLPIQEILVVPEGSSSENSNTLTTLTTSEILRIIEILESSKAFNNSELLKICTILETFETFD